MGFWVASTRNGSGIGKVWPPIDRCRSAITSSSADCTFAGRAVDLVGEHEVGHDRAELDVELLAALPVDAGAEDVGRHEVRGELQARERAADDLRDRLDGERLRHARHALEQQVPAGEQADQHPLDQPVLPDDHLLDLEDGALEALTFGGRARHGILHAHARIQHGPW